MPDLVWIPEIDALVAAIEIQLIQLNEIQLIYNYDAEQSFIVLEFYQTNNGITMVKIIFI